jgi:hypothetical protein
MNLEFLKRLSPFEKRSDDKCNNKNPQALRGQEGVRDGHEECSDGCCSATWKPVRAFEAVRKAQ